MKRYTDQNQAHLAALVSLALSEAIRTIDARMVRGDEVDIAPVRTLNGCLARLLPYIDPTIKISRRGGIIMSQVSTLVCADRATNVPAQPTLVTSRKYARLRDELQRILDSIHPDTILTLKSPP